MEEDAWQDFDISKMKLLEKSIFQDSLDGIHPNWAMLSELDNTLISTINNSFFNDHQKTQIGYFIKDHFEGFFRNDENIKRKKLLCIFPIKPFGRFQMTEYKEKILSLGIDISSDGFITDSKFGRNKNKSGYACLIDSVVDANLISLSFSLETMVFDSDILLEEVL